MATSTKKNRKSERAVIVTTEHRGVFFGYATDDDIDYDKRTAKIKRARLCLRWSRECKGFMGLAAVGPVGDSRVGPQADIALCKITSVIDVQPEAVKVWESAPWR